MYDSFEDEEMQAFLLDKVTLLTLGFNRPSLLSRAIQPELCTGTGRGTVNAWV